VGLQKTANARFRTAASTQKRPAREYRRGMYLDWPE
jgi:hypothetical protein